MGIEYQFDAGDGLPPESIDDYLRENPEVLREHARETVRGIAARVIGQDKLHLITIEVTGESPDDIQVRIRGDESLVDPIEAALAAEGQ